MKKHLIKSPLIALGLALAAQICVQAQTFTPITITPASFTQSVVVPSNWTYRLNAQSVTVTIDHGPCLQQNTVAGFPNYYSVMSGDTFFEVGVNRSSANASNNWGLPIGGSRLTNAFLGSSHVYQLPYWTNYNSNCLCFCPYTNGFNYNSQPLGAGPYVGQSYNNVNLALNSTTNYTALSFLCAGGGPFSNSLSISYADGFVQSGVIFAVPNWFVNANTYTMAGGNTPTATYAYSAQCRCNPAENQNNFTLNSNTSSGSRLWSIDIALSHTNSYPTNINIVPLYNNSGTSPSEVLFAVSASTNPADGFTVPNAGALTGPFAPIPISGFNAGCVVANSTNSLAGLAPLTATMDNGTNLAGGANTWFEQGYDLAAPTNGFPVHGSIINSSAYTNLVQYQMPASYNQPMCILIDTNHQTNNIVPVNTNIAYTGFSLLTAGASIGNGKKMTNYIIMQHSDGVNETNTFIGYDWFESSVTPAYIANERTHVGSSASTTGREVQNLDSGFPKLFDSQFIMTDGTPVTNIIAGYQQAPSANATTYIIAVSATTNFIPPQVPVVYTPAQNVYAGQTAVFSVTAIGTLPSYQWYVTDNATFTNALLRGATGTGSTIQGPKSSTLSVVNVGPADTNFYFCVMSNPSGSASSIEAPLTLLVSTNSPVALPGDTIGDFYYNGGGSFVSGEAFPSPAGLTLGNTIDETLAAYLNYGTSGTNTAYAGPVGVIVKPSMGATIVNALRFVVAVNAPICDPADFTLDGSTDGVTWANIVPYTLLNLPNVRNLDPNNVATATLPINITNQVLQEVDFANSIPYSSYRLTITNVKNNGVNVTANCMQIGEIQFLGTQAPLPPAIVQQPHPATTQVLSNQSVNWSVVANGPGPISYQWCQGSVANPIGGATTSTLTITNVSANASGFFCVVSNSYGATNSASVGYTVLPAATNNYVTSILADGPIAFLRLDEGPDNGSGNNGTVAYDIVGGHDGTYSNTVLQAMPPGSYSTNDASEAFAEFGNIADPQVGGQLQDNYVAGISGINFATPTNTSTNFSVEAWVYLNANTNGGAAVAAQGWGGNEQWAIDMGGTGNAFRFYFRTAGTNSVTVSPNTAPKLSTWYHVVGVLNESSNVESVFIDGALAATNALVFSNAPGLLGTNTPITIGARPSGSTTNFNLQLHGVVGNVAIYPYALNATQISNHYNATLMSPGILVQPTPVTNNLEVGGGLTTTAVVPYGPRPYSYQWYQVSGGATNMVTGATNAALTLSNVALTNTGNYYCQVSNPNGSINSASVALTVHAPFSPYAATVMADGPVAFLPLNEGPDNGAGNDGTTAYDYAGGHDGFYTNAVINQQGNPDTNGFDISAEFGTIQDLTVPSVVVPQDNYVGGISGVSFAAPTNTDSSFSVEAWVSLNANTVGGAGVVAMGTGGGGEEFALDMGGTGNAFRFYYRVAGSNVVNVTPNVAPVVAGSPWYHIVGIAYESNNVAYGYLYTNGVLAATASTTFSNAPGVLAGNLPMSIGSRTSSATTNYNDQLNGFIDNVAVYPYALSGAQVLNHYLASGIAPRITVAPANVTIPQGQVATFTSTTFGSSNLVYQWQVNGIPITSDGPLPAGAPAGTTAVVSGSSTGTLTVSNATFLDSGETYSLTVTNNFGTAGPDSATLTVDAAPVLSGSDLPTTLTAVGGFPFSLSAKFLGSLPLYYQWYYNAAPLGSSTRISGVNTNTLIVSPAQMSDAGTYQLIVSNNSGTNQTAQAVISVAPVLTFNGSGSFWSANGTAGGGYTSPNILELTDGGGSEDRSSFFNAPVYVGAFQASYTYTDVNGRGYTADADGACFVVQNDVRGAAALGGGGGSLGYSGVTNSVALQINLFQGFGIYFSENGAIVTTPPFDTDLDFATGHAFNIVVTYVNGVATATVQDATTLETFTLSTNVNIPSVVGGNFAYMGFTGADGGTTSIQHISNFQYIGYVGLSVQQAGGNNITLSWPAYSDQYQVESNSDLSNTNGWTPIAGTITVTNNMNQMTVTVPSSPTFYRLQLQ